MNNDMRLAFEAFCKRTASPGASSSEYYWMLFQAGAAYNDALAARLAEAELSRDSWKREAELNQQAADESAGYARRLAEAERSIDTLLGMIRHQRDVLRECLPYLNESMAGRRPGRSADDIRASVKSLTADSASVCGRCGGDGTVPSLDEYGFPARDNCPDCTAVDQPKDTGK